MAFKSEAQRRWAAEQVRLGKMTQAQFDDWDKDTPHKIPERKHPKAEGSTLKASILERQSYTKKRFS